jgi:uncharacterized protein YcfL
MKKNLVLIIVALFCFGVVATAKTKKVKLTGYVVDKACSAKISQKENVQEAAMGHTKKCALMDGCAKSGYSVFVDGKFYEFDAKGNETAKALLAKSSLEKGIKFAVEGKAEEASPMALMVKKITEAK